MKRGPNSRMLFIPGLLALLVAVAGCTAPDSVTGQVTAEERPLVSGYVWKEVARFQGQYDNVTAKFNISSDVWRITWNCQSQKNRELNIYIFPVGSHVIYKSFLKLACPGTGKRYVQRGQKGAFFIKVRANALEQWEILVEE